METGFSRGQNANVSENVYCARVCLTDLKADSPEHDLEAQQRIYMSSELWGRMGNLNSGMT